MIAYFKKRPSRKLGQTIIILFIIITTTTHTDRLQLLVVVC
jgi:hypothetical protein